MLDRKSGFQTIAVKAETYEKLVELARRNYRSVGKEIARLVDAEYQMVMDTGSDDELVEKIVAVPDAQK